VERLWRSGGGNAWRQPYRQRLVVTLEIAARRLSGLEKLKDDKVALHMIDLGGDVTATGSASWCSPFCPQDDLFRSSPETIINLRHPLVRLAAAAPSCV
jgi:hypothetical protein